MSKVVLNNPHIQTPLGTIREVVDYKTTLSNQTMILEFSLGIVTKTNLIHNIAAINVVKFWELLWQVCGVSIDFINFG